MAFVSFRICDKCGKEVGYATAIGITHAVGIARNNGWAVSRDKDTGEYKTLCPNCRKKKRGKEQ